MVAFLSLPVAAILAGLPRRRLLVVVAGVGALVCFTPILWALLSEPWTGVRWWRAIPLGTVERILGLAEVAVLLLLARWAATVKKPNLMP
ncbi:hypothetical protein [Actinoplanes sp. NPDC051494]|uniref:hypothetical protein n=1 Tax=Actinoplanes sp. NPDC051494 TaxID=3363907 RepID=UPI0037B351BF